MDELHPGTLGLFVRAVAVLGASPADQAGWLDLNFPGWSSTDELALEFEYGYSLLPQFVSLSWVNEAAREPADRVNDALERLTSEGPDAWSQEALGTNDLWRTARVEARRILFVLK